MKRHKFVACFLLIVNLVMLGNIGHSTAAPPLNGITVSPFLQQVSIGPNDTQKPLSVTLTNHTAGNQHITLSVKDFGSLNDSGGVAIEDNNDYSKKYGLASWLTLETDSVVLAAGESTTIHATVDNRSSLESGGHYGAIIASVENDSDGVGRNNVQLQQQLTALVLADKTGGEHYDLKLLDIDQNGSWLHLPNKIQLRFQNPSNIHVIPRGTVLLKNARGTVISKGIINSESAFILPESYRELYVPLNSVGNHLPWPGNYHIEVNYRYEGLPTTAQKKVAVRFLNLPLYAGLLVVLYGLWRLVRRCQNRKPKSKP